MSHDEKRMTGWIVAGIIAVVITVLPKIVLGMNQSFFTGLLAMVVSIGWLALSWFALSIVMILLAYASSAIYRKVCADEIEEKEKRDLVMNHIIGTVVAMAAIIVLVAHFAYNWGFHNDVANTVLSFIFPSLKA